MSIKREKEGIKNSINVTGSGAAILNFLVWSLNAQGVAKILLIFSLMQSSFIKMKKRKF